MEEITGSEADNSEERLMVASTAPEYHSFSAAVPNGNLERTTETTVKKEVCDDKLLEDNTTNDLNVRVDLHETVITDSEPLIEKDIPDVSSLVDNDQEKVIYDSNSLVSNDVRYASDHSRSIVVLSGALVEVSSRVVAHELADSTEATRTVVEEIPLLRVADGAVHSSSDAIITLSGAVVHGSADSLEASRKEASKIPQLGDASSTRVIVSSVNTDSSTSVQLKKDDRKQTLSLAELKYRKKDDVVKQQRLLSSKSEKQEKHYITSRGFVDTAAPFESVKEAVNKFGGTIDWKGYKKQDLERRKNVLSELEKVQQDISEHRKQSELAENAKEQVLKELDNTRKAVEELKVHLERAQSDEAQAKQDSELVQLRLKEMEQGIAGESSIAVKTQQEVAQGRHDAAIKELYSVKEEVTIFQEKCSSLISERDANVRKAEEAVSSSKEIEKTIDDLTLELITIKEALGSAHTAHLEAEEHRIGVALAGDQDLLTWDKELKQADEDIKRLTQQLSSTKDIKSKLDTACTTLVDLKVDLAAYMEAKVKQESGDIVAEKTTDGIDQTTETPSSLKALNPIRKELKEVKASTEKAKEDVNCLKVAASSFKSNLDKEKGALADLRQREDMASIAVSSLEAELEKTMLELEAVRMKEKEARQKIVELPKLLQQAAREADEAKSAAQSAKEKLRNAKLLLEQVTARASMTDIKLQAAFKEIEAAKASEKLALSAVKALKESEQSSDTASEDFQSQVTLPLDEYFNLSKKAHEAEELAHEIVVSAMAQVDEAKKSELKTLQRFEEAYNKMNGCKDALQLAKEKAEKAKQGKLAAEQDLRKWRAENEQRRKAGDIAKAAVNPLNSPQRSFSMNSNVKSVNPESDIVAHQVYHDSSYKPENSPGSNVSENKILKNKKPLFSRAFSYFPKTRQQ